MKKVINWCLFLALALEAVFLFAPMPPVLAALGQLLSALLIWLGFLWFTRGVPFAGRRAKQMVFLALFLVLCLTGNRSLPLTLIAAACIVGVFVFYNKVGRCPACGKRIPLFGDDGECPSCHAAVDAEENLL